MIWHALRTAWRLALAAFFRRIEVAGCENVPSDGAVLLVPNHTNAFMDAFLLATVVPRRVTPTAKSTLLRNPFMRFLLWASDAVPLHRQQDREAGADPAANREALAECRRRLSRGAALCIFPEGISHSDGHLRELRTGAARIALDFLAQDSKPLAIVPVGLQYEAKEKFRSAVWVRFGLPINAAAWRERHPNAGPRELTAEIEKRLYELTANFRRRREAFLLQWTAEVLATQGLPPTVLGREEGVLAERSRLASLLSEGYEKLEESHREEIGRLEKRVLSYHAELRRLGISPAEVYLEMDAGRAALFVVREAELLLIGFPLALLGTLVHGPAYLLARAIVRRISVDRDHWATNAVLFGSVLFLLSSVLELAAAWIFLSWPFALAFTVLLPYSGYYALLYRDRAGGIFRRSRTFLRFLFHRGLQRRLAVEGRAVIAGIERLAEAMPAES